MPVLVLHTAVNAWSWVMPVLPDGGSLRPYELMVGLMVLVALRPLCSADRGVALRAKGAAGWCCGR